MNSTDRRPPDVRLNRFPDGKTKVLTLSYDDGIKQDRKFVQKLNEYGLRGTFHLNSGFLGDEAHVDRQEVQPLYLGHEVAVHSVRHPHLAEVPKERVVCEIMEDRKSLESLVGYPIRGMSYPNGTFSQEVEDMLPTLGIAYSRTTNSTHSYRQPERYIRWNPTIHHNERLLERTDEFLQLPAWHGVAMFYVWGHSYEFDHDNNWDLIDRFGEKIGAHPEVWCAANIQVYDYIVAQKSLHFSAQYDLVHNPSALSVWISVEGASVEIPSGATVRLQ